MAIFGKSKDEHAGSGVDKPDPKSVTERVLDTVKSVLPRKDTGNGTAQPVAPDEAAT